MTLKNTPKGLPKRKRRTQAERTEETQLKLIEGMISALVDVGFSQATTSEIARRAKITTGALQHHYANKDQLLVAVIEHQFQGVREQLEGFVADQPEGKPDWREFLRILNDVYAGKRYLAVWEILLGTRSDRQLNTILMQHRIDSLAVLERIWFTVFAAEPDKPNQALSDLMHFVLADLRGRIFYDVLAKDEQFNARQQQLLEEIVEAKLHRLGSTVCFRLDSDAPSKSTQKNNNLG